MTERAQVVAVDTSAAVPFVLRAHEAHEEVTRALAGLRRRLTGHSLAECYAVLTRLPGANRLAPDDATRLIDANFEAAVTLSGARAQRIHHRLGDLGISGGAVYDALVGATAEEHHLTLATRDARAVGTYALVGATTLVVS